MQTEKVDCKEYQMKKKITLTMNMKYFPQKGKTELKVC